MVNNRDEGSGMISPTKAAAHRTVWVQPLDQAGCWLRLATGTEGRIRLRTGTGVHRVVTEYHLYVEGPARGVMITVPAFNTVFQYALHRYVTLEVDGQDDDGGRWTVVLGGVGHERHTDPPGQRVREKWPDALGRRQLYIPGMRLAGSVAHPCT